MQIRNAFKDLYKLRFMDGFSEPGNPWGHLYFGDVMYGKIFESMYDGTLYGQWEAIITFQQMIVLADKDGIVDVTPPALSARTSIPIDIIKKGIEVLEGNDPYSRTEGEDGKRIIRLDEHRPWGWEIVNYMKYRDMASKYESTEKARLRKQRQREREKLSR